MITIKEFHKGETLRQIISNDNYSSNDYDCRVIFQGKNVIQLTTEKINDGTFILYKTPIETLDFSIGEYRIFYKFYNSNDVKVVKSDKIIILEDIIKEREELEETDNEKLLRLINLRINGELLDGVQSFSIEGRNINNYSLETLYKERTRLEALVYIEKHKEELNAGKSLKNKLHVVFKV